MRMQQVRRVTIGATTATVAAVMLLEQLRFRPTTKD